MKKVIIALSLLTLTCGISHAYYYAQETSSVDVLEAQGYSENTLITVDKANKYNGGVHGKYRRQYVKKQPQNNFSAAYTKLKNYVDPIQDDGEFFDREINFANTWNFDSPSYAYPFVRENKSNSSEKL